MAELHIVGLRIDDIATGGGQSHLGIDDIERSPRANPEPFLGQAKILFGLLDRLCRDLEALNSAVQGEAFLFGDTPNVFDFSIAGFMAGVYDNRPGTWVTELAQPFAALRDYTERVQAHVGVYGRYV